MKSKATGYKKSFPFYTVLVNMENVLRFYYKKVYVNDTSQAFE